MSVQLPRIQGLIRRRLLVNFRVDPELLAERLPPPLVPNLQRGFGIAGICLIRFEQLRPSFLPVPVGLTSENAAHRIAVVQGEEEAVFIPRRDSDSWFQQVIGGTLFPGEHHRARFDVEDDVGRISIKMSSVDDAVSLEVTGRPSSSLPQGSVFGSLAEASHFFERGSLGYSSTSDPNRFDALVLDTKEWSVQPLDVSSVTSSFFEDSERFPEGSVAFDHALLMRDLQHEWRKAPDLCGAGAEIA